MDTSINSPPLPVHDIFLNPDNDQDQFFKRAPLARLRSSIAQSCHYGSPAGIRRPGAPATDRLGAGRWATWPAVLPGRYVRHRVAPMKYGYFDIEGY